MRMNYLAIVSLFAWLPAVIFLFASMPPRRAVVVAFVVAWLFLPNIGWKFTGIPDYTKSSATTFGVLIGLLAFDPARLMALRFRWFDLPMIINCLNPMIGALVIGAGAYEGASAVLDQVILWGLPYVIGRVYFSSLEGLGQLALGVVVGALVYIPFCLIEIRLSPMFETWVYGIQHWEALRYGGYRPKVFLTSGLELGMWMCNASLLAVRLWAAGTVRTLRGYSFGGLTLALLVTTVLCKSTGALVLMLVGLGALWFATRFKTAWPVWALVAMAPLYTSTRISGLWSGRELLEVAKLAGEDRAQSLEFRMQNEDVLIEHALKNAVFGGGRKDGVQVRDKKGKIVTVCDGYWIITFGWFGLVGLASLITMILLPVALLIRRNPPSTWSRPEVAPAAALAMMLTLIMIDELSNGMLNPIYAMIIGGLVALPAGSRLGRLQKAEGFLAAALEASASGHPAEAEPLFHQAIALASDDAGPEGLPVVSQALEGLGADLLSVGRLDEAEHALREAVAAREALEGMVPGPDHDREMALARGQFARVLALLGRFDEAVVERRRALDLWDHLAALAPDDPDVRAHRADALNDLAWLLVDEPEAGLIDAGHAVRLAEEAVRLEPDLGTFRNTLGVARYRAGDWPGAVEALEHSIVAGPPGGTAFDHFFLAMALHRLGETARARTAFDRAVEWTGRHGPGHPGLARYRDEATALMGRPGLLAIRSESGG